MDENLNFLGMINQAADMAIDNMLLNASKDSPMLVGLLKLLGEYDIHGMRAYEFITKMSAICSFFDDGGKKE